MSRVRGDVLAAASGALLLATGIGVGALGAHLLKPALGPEHFATLQTAVHYQQIDALGLLALGAWLHAGQAGNEPRALRTAVWFVIAGTLLFSGSLYGLLAGAPRLTGVLTPLGGSALIIGWCTAAWSLWRQRDART